MTTKRRLPLCVFLAKRHSKVNRGLITLNGAFTVATYPRVRVNRGNATNVLYRASAIRLLVAPEEDNMSLNRARVNCRAFRCFTFKHEERVMISAVTQAKFDSRECRVAMYARRVRMTRQARRVNLARVVLRVRFHMISVFPARLKDLYGRMVTGVSSLMREDPIAGHVNEGSISFVRSNAFVSIQTKQLRIVKARLTPVSGALRRVLFRRMAMNANRRRFRILKALPVVVLSSFILKVGLRPIITYDRATSRRANYRGDL